MKNEPRMQLVRLIDGPLAGKRRHVNRNRTLVTFEYDRADVVWPDHPDVHVTQIRTASYERVDQNTFRFVRAQQAIGDTDTRFIHELPKEDADE